MYAAHIAIVFTKHISLKKIQTHSCVDTVCHMGDTDQLFVDVIIVEIQICCCLDVIIVEIQIYCCVVVINVEIQTSYLWILWLWRYRPAIVWMSSVRSWEKQYRSLHLMIWSSSTVIFRQVLWSPEQSVLLCSHIIFSRNQRVKAETETKW